MRNRSHKRTLRSRPARQGKLKERGRTSEGVAKRRLRSLKRETGGGAPATQARAIRGNRTRQRRT
jgi:hypothetical protein